ncbi:uncharacterized protein [Diadema setosum]|uniref:uncharacterized protein n=1 Tax=Diadema setosum TaxID=31175 RepID=UPI003B3BD9CB
MTAIVSSFAGVILCYVFQIFSTDAVYLTLNCTEGTVERFLSCEENCVSSSDGWVVQAPMGRRILTEIESLNNRLNVKCYDEIPSVRLVNGPSLLEGLVVLGSDGYVCYNGFNTIAADLVCGELGFPAAENYSAQKLPSTATRKKFQHLSCLPQDSFRFQRLKDCPLATTNCSSNNAVQLKCREPGFLGCYEGNQQAFPLLSEHGLNVHSDEECISICRREPGHNEIAIMHQEMCVCSQYKATADVLFDRSYSHNWTCPIQEELEPGHFVYYLYNISVGFCNLPGHVINGQWDSNITRYGSKLSLTCDKGYIINGNGTLQCVELPGWSTYFPVWNTSVPSCRPVESGTNDTEWHSVNIVTSTTQNAVNTSGKGQYVRDLTTPETVSSSNNRQSTREPTAFHETTMSSSNPRVPERKFITFILGALLGAALLFLVTVSMAWCHHQQKRRRGTTQVSNRVTGNSDDGHLQMHPVNTSIENQRATNNVDPSSNNGAGAACSPLPSHAGNRFGNASPHQGDPYHVYQDTAEVDREVPLPAGTISLTAENDLGCHEYHSLQETSLQQAANSYEDCAYQDVDLDNRTGSMTKDDFQSFTGRACLFDDSCYNSLNFGERPDLVFAHFGNSCLDSEYDCINHASHDDLEQIHGPVPSASESSSGRDDTMSCSGLSSPKNMNSEDILYNNIDCEKSHGIYPSEYSLIRIDNSHDIDNPLSITPGPPPCEELHATVNKAAKTSSTAPPSCEELYAKVDKTAKTPSSIEELYAKVDKRRGDHTEVTRASQEELYINVTNM